MNNLKYRSQKNAEAAAKYWNKPLDKPEWYKIEALADDTAEVIIYDVIGWPFNDASELVRSLAGMTAKTITVRINSPGGDVFDAVSIFNALQSHKSKVITRVEGLAASAASFLALAGKEVQAYQNTMVMIHDPWVCVAGNQYELRETADILEKLSGQMVDIYAGNSSVGKKEIRDMMKAETWMTAKEAKEKGFIDTIVDGKSAKAQFDLSMFANAPEDLTAEIHDEPAVRKYEKALRDAGASKSEARAILARGLKSASSEEEVLAAKNLLNIIGGK
jgi:ATP-dependent Clp endopeptidase proteolytic subunit ClpP